jgi:membrane fusion protein (multidrug efflux system)
MKKRQWAIIGGAVILIAAFMLQRRLAGTPAEERTSRKLPVKGVEVIRIENADVPVEVHIDGKLNALNKIELYAEVNGVLRKMSKQFDEGIRYRKGETLLSLENSEATAAYLATQSEYINVVTQALPDIQIDYSEVYDTWQSYLDKASSQDHIPAPPETKNDQLHLFLTGRGVYSSYQSMESARIRLSKYRLSAPFDGIVTEALVDPGTLVRAGQRLGEFISPGTYELVSAISTSELALIETGDEVSLSSPDTRGDWQGEVFRINAKVDPATQRVKVFVRVDAGDLRDGMFMNGTIKGQTVASAFRLPRKLVYDNHYTYVVENDSILSRKELDIIYSSPGTIIAKGLPNGSILPKEPITGAFTGMKVKVVGSTNNETNPSTSGKN